MGFASFMNDRLLYDAIAKSHSGAYVQCIQVFTRDIIWCHRLVKPSLIHISGIGKWLEAGALLRVRSESG